MILLFMNILNGDIKLIYKMESGINIKMKKVMSCFKQIIMKKKLECC